MSTQGCMLPHHPALGQAPSSAGTQRLSHEKSSAETGRVPKLQSRALLPETAESGPLCVSSSACLASCLSAPAVSVSSRPPPKLCGHLCPGPGLQQLRPAAQPAHERRGRLPGHHPGKQVPAKQGPARLLRSTPWARPHPGQGSRCPGVAAPSSHRFRLTCPSWGRPAPSSHPISGSKSPRRRLRCPRLALPAHGSLPTSSPEAQACGLPHVTRVCPPPGLGVGPSAGPR